MLAFHLWGNGSNPSLCNFLNNQWMEREAVFYLQLFQLGKSLDGFREGFEVVVVQISETNTDICQENETEWCPMFISDNGRLNRRVITETWSYMCVNKAAYPLKGWIVQSIYLFFFILYGIVIFNGNWKMTLWKICL